MDNKPLTTDEIAALFAVSTRTVRRWMDAGMPVLKPSPGVLRFDAQACIDWARTTQQASAV
jgi:phage terminase Nu1 subunit (DNA packaging protein)